MADRKTYPFDAKAYVIKRDGTLPENWGAGSVTQKVPTTSNWWPQEISVGDYLVNQ